MLLKCFNVNEDAFGFTYGLISSPLVVTTLWTTLDSTELGLLSISVLIHQTTTAKMSGFFFVLFL